VIVVALFAFGDRRGRAAPDQAASRAACTVTVALVGDAALDPLLARRIASWFDRGSFRIDVRAVPRLDAERVLSPQPGSCAWVWVTLRADRSARVYFVRGVEHDALSYLVRDLRLEHGLDEIGSERVAEAIHFSVLALLEGGVSSDRADVVRALEGDAATPTAPPKDPSLPPDRARAEPQPQRGDVDTGARAAHGGANADARSSRRDTSVDIGLGYAVAFRGDEGWGHGPRATLRVPLAGAFSMAASVRSALPTTAALGAIDLRLYGATFAAALAWTVPVSRRASIDFLTGPAVEWVHYEPVASNDPAVVVGTAASEVRPAWDFGVRATFDVPLRWGLVAECPISLNRTAYEVGASTDRKTIGRPWILSPSAGIEIRF
jgi:hypothetical protein